MVLGAACFAFFLWSDTLPWWLFLLLGIGIGSATYRGNAIQVTGPARLVAAGVGLATALVLEYFAYRHLALEPSRHGDVGPHIPLVMSWQRTSYLFNHSTDVVWWLLVAITVVGAVASRPGWVGRASRR